MNSITLKIEHSAGLHARPATLFAKKANEYKSDIKVMFCDQEVNAKSVLSLLTLGVEQGVDIIVSANGEDANEALEGLKNLVSTNFGE